MKGSEGKWRDGACVPLSISSTSHKIHDLKNCLLTGCDGPFKCLRHKLSSCLVDLCLIKTYRANQCVAREEGVMSGDGGA